MQLLEEEGNIFTCGIQTIVCPVDLTGVISKGLALDFKFRMPGIDKTYKQDIGLGELYAGKVTVHQVTKSNTQVLLLPTKYLRRGGTDIKILKKGLVYIASNLNALGVSELALTAIGCGNGNLSYLKDIKPLIKEVFKDTDLKLTVILK